MRKRFEGAAEGKNDHHRVAQSKVLQRGCGGTRSASQSHNPVNISAYVPTPDLTFASYRARTTGRRPQILPKRCRSIISDKYLSVCRLSHTGVMPNALHKTARQSTIEPYEKGCRRGTQKLQLEVRDHIKEVKHKHRSLLCRHRCGILHGRGSHSCPSDAYVPLNTDKAFSPPPFPPVHKVRGSSGGRGGSVTAKEEASLQSALPTAFSHPRRGIARAPC